jgi:hypothetical protein
MCAGCAHKKLAALSEMASEPCACIGETSENCLFKRKKRHMAVVRAAR